MMNNDMKDMKHAFAGEDSANSKGIKKSPKGELSDQPGSPEKTAEIPHEPKESAGVILKRAREAQGVSLEIVHETTKIPLDALRAIEEGYTVRMLSPFYYKGFVKMYAGYLGIDVSEVIEDYKPEELPEHIDQDVEELEAPKWVTEFFTRKRKQQIIIAIGAVLVLFLLVKLFSFFIHRKPHPVIKKSVVKSEIVKKEPVKKNTVQKEAKKIAEEPRQESRQEPPKIVAPKVVPKIEPKEIPPAPKPVAAAVVIPAPIIQKNIILTVRAKQNSWLRVKADNNIVFQSTLRLGAVETWTANDEIEISGKNVDQLEFELNSKMIGVLGGKDRNAKKIVITKDGLSVKN